MNTALSAFVVAFVTATSLTGPVRQLAFRLGMVDLPGPRKIHLTPIPLLGGLAIYVGAVLATTFFGRGVAAVQIWGILAGATLLAGVGILDDRGLLHHQIKLFVGMPLAALVLIASGVRAGNVLPFESGTLGVVTDVAATLFWVVGVTAAFSILDHMDGLCAGIAAISSAFFMFFAISNGQVFVATLAAALFGASLGFLRWNFTPAKIFMGDGGAMFLGYMLAVLSLKLRLNAPGPVPRMVPILILGVPCFDTLLVIVSRSRRGLTPFTSPGKDHTAHRLANLVGRRRAVTALYIGSGLLGLLAWRVQFVVPALAYVLAGSVAAIALAGIVALERVPFECQSGAKRAK